MCVARETSDLRGVQVHTDREGPGDGPVGGAHEYDYGDSVARASVPATEPPVTETHTTETPATELVTAEQPTSETPSMGTTTPRAVLRPIPEGFPTPPPRFPGPRRRPERAQEPESTPRRGRGPLLAALVLGLAVLLVLGVGGLVLAVRGVGGQEGPVAAPAPSADGAEAPAEEEPAAGNAAGEATIGGVHITEVSTEVGVRRVGNDSLHRVPEGEFVIITLEVENPTDSAIDVQNGMQLETADGTLHDPDREAGRLHIAESHPYGFTISGQTRTYHTIFDVPIGEDPTSLHITVQVEAGELPLGG